MSQSKPTDNELAILNVLWAHGQATVREVYDALYRDDGGGYTTALKMLQVMHAKGLVERDSHQRAHVYRATCSKEQTQRNLLADLVRRAFDGKPSQLVLQALGDTAPASEAELAAIRSLLTRLEAE